MQQVTVAVNPKTTKVTSFVYTPHDKKVLVSHEDGEYRSEIGEDDEETRRMLSGFIDGMESVDLSDHLGDDSRYVMGVRIHTKNTGMDLTTVSYGIKSVLHEVANAD